MRQHRRPIILGTLGGAARLTHAKAITRRGKRRHTLLLEMLDDRVDRRLDGLLVVLAEKGAKVELPAPNALAHSV